eukprot:gi/632982630/ref/XP_007908242.1/ PREDICTED: cAMP-specific 3',5'-cyclic phosphodiesterase 4B [Callorhinchus milii]
MKKSRSVLAVTTGDMGCETVELSKSCTSTGNTLGVDLRRGRRRFSGTLQLPPLSWRQGERARTPERDPISRPTTLQLRTPPRIAITPVDQDRRRSPCEIQLSLHTEGLTPAQGVLGSSPMSWILI